MKEKIETLEVLEKLRALHKHYIGLADKANLKYDWPSMLACKHKAGGVEMAIHDIELLSDTVDDPHLSRQFIIRKISSNTGGEGIDHMIMKLNCTMQSASEAFARDIKSELNMAKTEGALDDVLNARTRWEMLDQAHRVLTTWEAIDVAKEMGLSKD